MRSFALLLAALLAGAALAGCTGNDDDDMDPTPATSTPDATPDEPAPTPAATPTATPATPAPVTPAPPVLDSNTFALATTGSTTQVKVGNGTTFMLYANGTQNVSSEHIGAHYADNDTSTPTAPGRKDCEHVNGSLPGSWSIGCTFATAGIWHVYGHARVAGPAGDIDYWAAPFVVKARDYNLTATVPPQATYGTDFAVAFNVTALGGSDNATSDHIGAHWFNNTEDATTELAAGTCTHLSGMNGVVGPHSVTCNVPQDSSLPAAAPKTVYVRAHIRITEGATTLSWWSQPYAVSVQSVSVPLPGFP